MIEIGISFLLGYIAGTIIYPMICKMLPNGKLTKILMTY